MASKIGSTSYPSNDFPIATTPTRDNVFLGNLLVGSYCSNTLGGAIGWSYTNEAGQTVAPYNFDEKNALFGPVSLFPVVGDQAVNQQCEFGKNAGCQPLPPTK
jgi:hypothetical protein